jgi:hypothetical protein
VAQNVDINTPVKQPDQSDRRTGRVAPADLARRRRANLWIVPIALIVAAFLIYQLPPYLSLDPAQARRPLQFPVQFWLLVGHVGFGTVALVTMCLQLWPWLRLRHPAVHRWSGRLYVYAGALPTAVLAVAMFPFIPSAGSIGVVVSAVLWSAAAVIGLRMARRRRYPEHRRWMLYSFAIVWGQVIWGFAFGQAWLLWSPWQVDFGYVVEAVRWVGWIVNLIIVHWWVERTSGRPLKLPSWERQPVASA